MDVTRAYPHGCTAYCLPSVHYHSDNVRGCCFRDLRTNVGNGKFGADTCRFVVSYKQILNGKNPPLSGRLGLWVVLLERTGTGHTD
jgi:hypothetical protein